MLQQYYDILGISSDATKEQIKRAYRKKAKEFHPDANSDADAKLKFQVLNEAYHILISKYQAKISEPDFSIEDYKKYGTSIRNKTYNVKYHQKNNSTNDDEKETYKPNTNSSDKYIYYVFILIGLNMLVLAIKKLLFDKWEGLNNVTAFITSAFFLIIIFYGWNVLKNSQKK